MIFDAYCEFRFRARKKQIESILEEFFNFPVKLKRLPRRSSRDSIYSVVKDNKIIAIARVRNKFRLKKLCSDSNKFNTILNKSRSAFNMEWNKYMKAYPYSLAPRPLCKSEDFVVNEYINFPNALEVLQKDFNKFGSIITQVVENLRKLHQIGIIHGDAALYNCLLPNKENCIFIDMESTGSKLKSQQAKLIYDYLHLADSTIKFLPKKHRRIEPWINIFNTYINPKFEDINISRFKERFHRLNNLDPDFRKLEKVFV